MKHMVAVIVFLFSASVSSFSQITTSAVPFLLISPSPEANGIGGISSSLMTDNPMAVMTNPGQLGIQSLGNLVGGSTYTKKTQWLPDFGISDLTYHADAATVGLNFNKIFSLPFDASLGVGYSRINLNLGEFVRTGNDPLALETFHAFEKADMISLGIGLEYIAKLGFGYNFKRIESHLAPFIEGDGTSIGYAKVRAYDIGAIASVPIVTLYSFLTDQKLRIFPSVEPLFDITFGYACENVGGDISYNVVPDQKDLLPRRATLGLSWELGLTSKSLSQDWKLLSFVLSKQSEDLLITKSDYNSHQYQGGTGDIHFFKNVILGKRDTDIDLRKGWQLNFFEFIYVRGGSFDGIGNLNYTTEGYSLRLAGLWKILEFIDSSIFENGIFNLVAQHLDVSYHFSQYRGTLSPINGTEFSSLSLLIK